MDEEIKRALPSARAICNPRGELAFGKRGSQSSIRGAS
jgi:hypothetical protein